MEVKPGYKQTEVGVIPEDWEVSRLGDFAELLSSKRIFESDYVSTGIPFYRGKEITLLIENKPIPEEYFISEARYEEIQRKYGSPTKGDILITAVGTLGNVYLVPDDRRFYFKDGNLIWLRRVNGIDSRYFTIQIRNRKREIVDNAIGSSQKAITIVTLKETLIPVPPTIAEQEAIAEALSDADALISGLEKLIAKKRNIKQGAMQQLLKGKKRLPGFSGKLVVKALGEIAHIKTGSRNNQDKVEDGEYPFFVRSATVERINSYSYDCEAILVPGEGGIGSIFHYISGRFDLHQRVYGITQFSHETSGKYVYFYMVKNFGVHAMQNSVKATVDSLRLPTFQNFEIVMPSTLDEQTAIAATLSDMDAEVERLEQKLEKYKMIKQGMIQELLTGRTRLV